LSAELTKNAPSDWRFGDFAHWELIRSREGKGRENSSGMSGGFYFLEPNAKYSLTNRLQYTYIRECRCMKEETSEKIPTWVILSQSKQVSSCPDKSGIVRVNDYKQNLTLQRNDQESGKTRRMDIIQCQLS